MAILKVGSGGAPVGNYAGPFVGVEPTPPNAAKGYGPGLRWKWKIDAGPHAGTTVGRVTTNEPSPKNSAGQILSGLLGRPLKEGEELDPDQFVGRRYAIVVGPAQNGAT